MDGTNHISFVIGNAYAIVTQDDNCPVYIKRRMLVKYTGHLAVIQRTYFVNVQCAYKKEQT